MKKCKDKFETSDLLLATSLLYFNFTPLRIERKQDSNRFVFVFEWSQELEELQLKLLEDKVSVSPRKFVSLMRSLKAMCIVQNANK